MPRPADRDAILPPGFYARPAGDLAPDLLGRHLVRVLPDGRPLIVRIVETEAYLGFEDRASHGYAGRRTERNESLYLPGGHAYVYFIYGVHYCFNVVAGGTHNGEAVLIRAGEPIENEEVMANHRGLTGPIRPGDVAGGPGKLAKALAIDKSLDGLPLTGPPLYLTHGEPPAPDQIAAGPRIGIDYAQEAVHWPLRFAIRGNPHQSKPRL